MIIRDNEMKNPNGKALFILRKQHLAMLRKRLLSPGMVSIFFPNHLSHSFTENGQALKVDE